VGEPAPCIELDHQGSIVKICDESWEPIVLPVDDTVPSGSVSGDSGTELECLVEAAGEEPCSDLLPLPLDEEANSYRAIRVIETGSQEAILPIENDRDVPGGTWAALREDAPIEEPWVSFADRAFCGGLNPQGDPRGRSIRRRNTGSLLRRDQLHRGPS